MLVDEHERNMTIYLSVLDLQKRKSLLVKRLRKMILTTDIYQTLDFQMPLVFRRILTCTPANIRVLEMAKDEY
jgi:hypothetical protein